MFAKRLESILEEEAASTNLSGRWPADIAERFESLRGYGLLPRGRGKNSKHLSISEIVAAVLSIATVRPGFGGLASSVLKDLCPVGGIDASFERCTSFGKAVERVFEVSAALDSLAEIRVSDSEMYTNSNGRATIEFIAGNSKKTAYYIGKSAYSVS